MADPKKNPLIGAFRAPALGSAPPATAEDTPKATTPVQATAPKTMELPKGAPPKSQTNDVAPATPIEGKKPQKPPKAEDLKGKAEGAATTTPAEGKKSEEPPKATDPKGKAEGAAPAGPTEGKKPEEPPKTTDSKGKAEGAAPAGPTGGKKPEEPLKATDPKGKAEGAAPAGSTEGKKPEEPPKITDSKGKAEKAAPSTPTETKKPEKPTRTPTPKVEIVSATAQKVAASTQDEIPSDFSLTIVPNDKLGTVAMMPIDLIDDFEGHPFAVRDDADMKELVASIKQVGLLEPATVIRNERKIGRFEMVAGHRRKHAAKLAGLTHIPVIVRDMDHDEATIYMVDSNLKREKLTPMEKARAYTMKTEALRRKMGRRSKEELAALEAEGKKPMTADQELAAQTGESVATVQRFKTLTKLTPPMQQMVDKGELPVNTAADIAQMKPEEQNALADAIEKEAKVPSGTAAKELKEASRAGTLTAEKIQAAVAPTKREETPPLKLTLNEEDLRPYFPDKRTTVPDAKKAIFEGLTLRNKMIERQAAKAKAEKDAKKKTSSIER